MIFKRLTLALMALLLGLILGSCSQFSGTVADHWPHWAGGEPTGTPPRPGAPGYQEFIAHRQAGADAAQPAAANTQTSGQPAPTPAPANPPSDDTAVARGGLY